MSHAATADEPRQVGSFDPHAPVMGVPTVLSVLAAVVAEMRRMRCDAQRRHGFMDS